MTAVLMMGEHQEKRDREGIPFLPDSICLYSFISHILASLPTTTGLD
jgi:hypothetical protein